MQRSNKWSEKVAILDKKVEAVGKALDSKIASLKTANEKIRAILEGLEKKTLEDSRFKEMGASGAKGSKTGSEMR